MSTPGACCACLHKGDTDGPKHVTTPRSCNNDASGEQDTTTWHLCRTCTAVTRRAASVCEDTPVALSDSALLHARVKAVARALAVSQKTLKHLVRRIRTKLRGCTVETLAVTLRDVGGLLTADQAALLSREAKKASIGDGGGSKIHDKGASSCLLESMLGPRVLDKCNLASYPTFCYWASDSMRLGTRTHVTSRRLAHSMLAQLTWCFKGWTSPSVSNTEMELLLMRLTNRASSSAIPTCGRSVIRVQQVACQQHSASRKDRQWWRRSSSMQLSGTVPNLLREIPRPTKAGHYRKAAPSPTRGCFTRAPACSTKSVAKPRAAAEFPREREASDCVRCHVPLRACIRHASCVLR